MGAGGPFQEAPFLRVDNLCIARGGRIVFEGVSFSAGAGDFVELRGANGAGKTSLLRALAGFLKPRAGRIAFEGVEEPGLALHYLAHANALKPSASANAHVRYWAGLFGGDGGAALARVGLGAQADLPARALSQGQARRLALARLLTAPRPIWLLDEPAAALDAPGRALLQQIIAEHRRNGGLAIAALHEHAIAEPTQTVRLEKTP